MKTGRLAVLMVLIAFACVGCGSAGPSGAAPEGSSATPVPANQENLDRIADAVRAVGDHRFPTVYAGVAIDTDSDTVQVWRRASPAFDAYLRGEAWGAAVRLHDAAHSAAELRRVQGRVEADRSYWQRRGLVLHTLGARHDGSCVEVGTEDPGRTARDFGPRYPGLPLCFVLSAGAQPL